MEYQSWFDYAEFDEQGDIIGLKKNVPYENKKEYDIYLKQQKTAMEGNIKI